MLNTSLLAAFIFSALAPADTAPVSALPPDIQHYELTIRPDIARRRLHLDATVDIANPRRDTTFTFRLADWYDSVTVQGRTGRATVERASGEITVRVPRASRYHEVSACSRRESG
jgi:hypothetical protein